MRPLLALAAACTCVLVLSAPAGASGYVRYGLQDDAWISYGPGTLDGRLNILDSMGVKLVRYTLHWNEIEARKGTYAWGRSDAILRGLHARGMVPVGEAQFLPLAGHRRHPCARGAASSQFHLE